MATKAQLEAVKFEAETDLARAEAALAHAKREHIEQELHAIRRDNADIDAGHYYHRVYPFVGGVDRSSALACMNTLSKWSRVDPGCKITLVFNSPGGSVIDGLALYDHLIDLRGQGHRIITVARGMAASMGGVLLQAGDVRIMGRNAHVLIHEVSTVAIGKFSEIEDEVAFSKRLQERLVNILAERSTAVSAPDQGTLEEDRLVARF